MGDFLRVQLDDPRGRQAEMLLPDGPGPWPGVVVIHDLLGLRPDTRRHCRNFADAGYASIAPDLFGGGAIGCVVSTMTSLLRQEGEGLAVIDAARSALANHPSVDPARIGITGFCMGGGFALLAAADGPYAVAAPFYGDVPRSSERLRGVCPTLAQAGATDRIFSSGARRLAAHLDRLGVEHEVIIYDGVGHSFMNRHDSPVFAWSKHTPLRAGYEPRTEARAWAALLAFFARHMPPATSAGPPA